MAVISTYVAFLTGITVIIDFYSPHKISELHFRSTLEYLVWNTSKANIRSARVIKSEDGKLDETMCYFLWLSCR